MSTNRSEQPAVKKRASGTIGINEAYCHISEGIPPTYNLPNNVDTVHPDFGVGQDMMISDDSSMNVLTDHLSVTGFKRSSMIRLSPMSRLPPELLTAVFQVLYSRNEEIAFIMTCKTWFACGIDSIWYRPYLTSIDKFQLFLRTVEQSPSQLTLPYQSLIRRLNLSGISEQVTDSDMLRLLQIRNLERLTITNCGNITTTSLASLITYNSKIQSIDISNLELIQDNVVQALASNCKHLQGFYASNCKLLTDVSIIELAVSCKLLKRIKINGCNNITDMSVMAIIANCPLIVELDLTGCQEVSNEAVSCCLNELSQLREFKLATISNIRDEAFFGVQESLILEKLRVIDLTSCFLLSDDSVGQLVAAAPRLRNVVLAKCLNITDRGVEFLTSLGKCLHFIHLGHCGNITDRCIKRLVTACPRIQYIDVACCTQLTDESVKSLAHLTRLRRIGLVKCQNITDEAVLALASRIGVENTLERIHLSYCGNISLLAVMNLVNACQKLTHLSLTGVPPFMRHDLTQFCRTPPREFTQHQQALFCVFSGNGVKQLRNHLNGMSLEQRQERIVAVNNAIIEPPITAQRNDMLLGEPRGMRGTIRDFFLTQRDQDNHNIMNRQLHPQPLVRHPLPQRPQFDELLEDDEIEEGFASE